MTNVIRTLEIYNDMSRLYLLIRLDLCLNNLTYTIYELSMEKLCKSPPEAVSLANNLKDIFPNADPIYLDLIGEMYIFDEHGLSELIEYIITSKKSYPKVQAYNERIKVIEVIKSLTINFNVEKFLSICPDPVEYFKNKKYNSLSAHVHESMSYLCNK